MLDAWRPSQPPNPFVDDFAGGRRGAPRCEATLNLSIRFSNSLNRPADNSTSLSNGEMYGETCNISETGLAISVASNHIGDRYFNVIGCTLALSLELPDGPVQILATPAWCKWLVEDRKVRSYLLGLRILEMSDEEWVRLVRYVHSCL